MASGRPSYRKLRRPSISLGPPASRSLEDNRPVSELFHHVIVALDDHTASPRCIFKDLTKRKLKQQFLKPYRKGQDILSDNNEVVRTATISKIQVIRTPACMEEELRRMDRASAESNARFNAESDSILVIGLGSTPEDIAGAQTGQDVTLSGHLKSGHLWPPEKRPLNHDARDKVFYSFSLY